MSGDLRDSPYLRELINAQTARHAPEVATGAVATGPAMSAYGYFAEIAPVRPELYEEAKLYNPKYEPIPVTRLARSSALGGDLIVPIYAIDLQTGELDIDWYQDSTTLGRDPAYYSGRGRRSPTILWRPLKVLARAVGPAGEFNSYRDGGSYWLPHHLTTPSSSAFPDPELWPEVEERWRATLKRMLGEG